MTRYIALIRAVNVGGTGKLPMAQLKAACRAAGFANVETYIASGNVVFDAKVTAARVKAALEAELTGYLGKPASAIVRTAAEMAAILKANPFAKAEPKHTYVVFLDAAPPRDALGTVSGQQDEQLTLGKREIYVHYPHGMGRSKLKIPAAATGTARNLNTVRKLVEIASKT